MPMATDHSNEAEVAPPATVHPDNSARRSLGSAADLSSRIKLGMKHGSTPFALMAGLLLWESVVRLFGVSELFLAPPSGVLARFWEMAESGELWRHASVSYTQFILGYSIAAILGIVLGITLGLVTRMRRLLEPWITALYATPTISLAPLFIIWLGLGITSKAAIVGLISFFPIVINTLDGVDVVDAEYDEFNRAFSLNFRERFAKVTLPGTIPFIFSGLRLGVGRGVVGIVAADLFGSVEGLGYMILRSSQTFNTTDLFVATLILSVTAVLLIGASRRIERLLSPWRYRT